MFKRVLLANRGEIALRVQRTCAERGIETVAVYTDPDRNGLHVRSADAAVRIGSGPAADSYLSIETIISAAKQTGADAVHPGYGFLSENAAFADACEEAGLTFIGPPASAMRAMGDKVAARRLMEGAGVPVIPGANDIDPADLDRAAAEAERVGFPLLVKAASGGGGRGIRLVERAEQLEAAMRAAGAEAQAAFADATIFLERYLSPSRHIEVQIMADAHGTVHAYGERECSVQRRHQKLIEEAPSVAVTPELRARLCETAIAVARSCGYRNAGTVEFLVDGDGEFFFLEMNARLQVEHPVSEFVYGVDLVAEQLHVAAGEALTPDPPGEIRQPSGWAIECRINGEDPYRGSVPSLGVVEYLQTPMGPGVRFDTMLYDGLDVPVFYDSLLGKLIVWAEDRPRAIRRMQRALGELMIAGIQTNAPLHQALLDHPDYLSGDVHTAWFESNFEMPALSADDPREEYALIAAALAADLQRGASAATADNGGSRWLRTARQQRMQGARGWHRGTAS